VTTSAAANELAHKTPAPRSVRTFVEPMSFLSALNGPRRRSERAASLYQPAESSKAPSPPALRPRTGEGHGGPKQGPCRFQDTRRRPFPEASRADRSHTLRAPSTNGARCCGSARSVIVVDSSNSSCSRCRPRCHHRVARWSARSYGVRSRSHGSAAAAATRSRPRAC
jgi:hypothetical protein